MGRFFGSKMGHFLTHFEHFSGPKLAGFRLKTRFLDSKKGVKKVSFLRPHFRPIYYHAIPQNRSTFTWKLNKKTIMESGQKWSLFDLKMDTF